MKITAFQLFNSQEVKSFKAEVTWADFVKVTDDGIDEMITLRVIPDRTVTNKENYRLIHALHDLYETPLSRFGFGRWFIRYTPKSAIWYDVLVTKDSIKFYFTVPRKWETYARQKISGCWPRASIDSVDGEELNIPIENTNVSELIYKRHNIFALRVDRAEDTQPLSSVMSACRDMKDGDLARLSICADPNNRLNWQDQAEKAHKQFAQGKTPGRRNLSRRKALMGLGTGLDGLLQQLSDLLALVLGSDDVEEKKKTKFEKMDIEKRQILIEGTLQRSTTTKRNEPTFVTHIRVASHSEDDIRREINSRALGNSFIDVSGDNELERVEVKSGKTKIRILGEINRHRLSPASSLELDTNIMSASELGKLTMLPTPGLQDDYADQLETITQRQDGPPASVTGGGILLGEVELKKERIPIYKPIDNYEELCLPDIDVGGMGVGKTKGQAANTIVEAVRNGFTGVSIDPAKKEIGVEVMSYLDPSECVHYDLSKMYISLDWRECNHSKNMTTRMANTILNFFDMEGNDTPQTERFLFAAIFGMKTTKLGEIIKIFGNDEYRQEIISSIKDEDNINRKTLEEFGAYSPDRRRAILAPINNRLSILLRDPYLDACMKCDDGIDFVEIFKQRGKAIIFDIPDDTFDKTQKDVIVNILMVKIDIAMRLRKEEDQFPIFIVMDEPHQYLRSAKIWTSAAVEGRKYRVKYCWLFHSFEQIPADLSEIILSAGPHFHIYRSSARTYKILKPFLLPYTEEEVIKMPLWHAINIIRANRQTTRPFMAKMADPPSKRKPKLELVAK